MRVTNIRWSWMPKKHGIWWMSLAHFRNSHYFWLLLRSFQTNREVRFNNRNSKAIYWLMLKSIDSLSLHNHLSKRLSLHSQFWARSGGMWNSSSRCMELTVWYFLVPYRNVLAISDLLQAMLIMTCDEFLKFPHLCAIWNWNCLVFLEKEVQLGK